MYVQVTDHARQLMEKYLRKPFFDGGYAGSMPRMNAADLEEGIAWVDDRFFPIRYEDEALPSVDWVLNVAKAAVLRYAEQYCMSSACTCKGAVIVGDHRSLACACSSLLWGV